MKKNNVYILEDRGLLYVSGDDVKEFLQNIITNDIDAVSENNSCFAGLLSPQGKYLYDFIVVKHKSGYFLDCEKKIIDELYKQLTLYKLRSKVEILNLSNEFVVAALHKNKFLELENSKDQNGYTTKFREDTILLDPRHTELGARLIINLEKLYLSLLITAITNSLLKFKISTFDLSLYSFNWLNKLSIIFFSQSKKYPDLCFNILKSYKYFPCGVSKAE